MPKHQPPHHQVGRIDDELSQRDDSDWGRVQDAEGRDRARRLLSEIEGAVDSLRPRRGRWLKRVSLATGILIVVLGLSFGGLWWRLGEGPINFDVATPWLVEAITDNLGQGKTVEIGGTQIERTGPMRIAVRIRDIVVKDSDDVIVASAPKAEVRIASAALLTGRLRAESINLVDATLSVRITPDGDVIVSTGADARPIATGLARHLPGAPVASVAPRAPVELPLGQTPPSQANPLAPDVASANLPAGDPAKESNTLLAGLEWLDSLSQSGLDGQNLNEIGLKNGRLVVDDQQRGNRWEFENISVSLRRPSGGGVAMSLGEQGEHPWSLAVIVSAAESGTRKIDVRANKVSTKTLLLALRSKDLTYGADLPLTGEIRGEIGRDGMPNYLNGKITVGAGTVTDEDTPTYPMHIDQGEINLEWDPARRVLIAPFKMISDTNRVTSFLHVTPPKDGMPNWQVGMSGGTIVLGGSGRDAPLIFNRIALNLRFETDKRRVLLTQADIGNDTVGVAGTGSVDYSAEPRLTLGFAGTPMSASELKRMWPILVVPEVREWVIERIERGQLQRIEIGVNSPVKNLSRRGPPIPDDGLSVNITGTGITLRPVDDFPVLKDADLKARVTGRTATVSIGQTNMETSPGRKLTLTDVVFEVPDLVPKPAPAKIRFKLDGTVPAVADILNSGRLSDVSGNLLDPNTMKGNVSAQVTLGLPIQRELKKADTIYAVNADLTAFSADKMVMNQKVEASALKVIANNQGYQVKGDVKISGQAASIDYRKPSDGDAEIRLQATLDDAGRTRLGGELGTAVTGAVPIKVNGKIGSGDRDSKFNVEADLTPLKLDNLLPGWTKAAGKPGRAVFNVTQKPQSTKLEDIVIDGSGTSIKGSLELDQNADLINANLTTFSPSEGDKTTLRAERNSDGVIKVVMRGDVFDARGFIKSAISGREPEAKAKGKPFDFDVDLKLGAVAGFFGEAVRSVDAKMSRRNGAFKTFTLNGKLGRDTPLTGDLRSRSQGQGREVIFIETNDAGALFRFTDTYSKLVGGQMSLAMEPPTSDSKPKEGLLNLREFAIKGEESLDNVAAGGPGGAKNGVRFSRLRAEFTRQNGQLTIREGVVKGPAVGGTIEGSINYPANEVRMSGTFVPLYGLNNMFGQIPLLGLFLGGSNEGLFGLTYEVVGSPGKPELRINPMSAMAPGVLRKIFEFGTGKQNNQSDFPGIPNN